ncbi:PKD domain-containing protein [Prolixibacteraceae bacterium Z1-6]|uniref:PKD domain-containing protein n=1 Tax=Draconibacterium aestuarii TaxID=2998507 RepID=A0A9X3J4W4_9BACT|nr:PKD domain-containing protein [Prolixibacteraceae bacterium Z1-6]
MKKQLISILLLLIIAPYSWCYEGADPCRKSTEGNDFWFGFMESRNYSANHYIEITVTAREATTFTITIGTNETPFQGVFSVAANNSQQIRIPWDMVEALGSESIENKGLHLVSQKPVNVYALNYDKNSADVAVIYPTESLGKEYFAMCYDVNINERNDGTYGNGRNSEFLVVASEDSTKVLIIPSKVTDQLVQAGDSINITLNKGEVYQVQSKNRNNLSGQGDLTQSYIKSSKPVAFYSGSLGTTVPATSGTSAWDHLYEQIPPIHSWGREYYTTPLKSRNSDRYRIIAAEDNTTIHISNKNNITLNRGEFEEIVLYSTEPSRIFSDKPIMVAQYSQSNNVDGTGDPFMIILSSVTQSKNDVTFVAYDSEIIQNYFVNIITLTEEINNIRLNGNSISGSFQAFPEGKYSFAQITINPGTHRIKNLNEDRGFLAYVYGYGGVESYGYGVGFNLDLVLDLGESINFNGDTLLLCYGESVTLDAGPYFDTYQWNTGDTTQILKIISGGEYSVKTTTIDGCQLEDSIYIYVSQPEVDLGIDYDEGCAPYSIELNGSDGFDKYIWQNQKDDTLSTSQFYTANITDEYRITVYNKYNCPARDTMNLVVFPVPDIEISGETLICGAKESELTVNISNAPESVWNYNGSFKWSSNNPSIVFSNQSHKKTTLETNDWGKFEIYYELTTTDACITIDTFRVQFEPTPTSAFKFVDDPDDECKGYSREVLYTGNATKNANYYWDYGGAKLIETFDWNNFTVSIGAYNSNPYLTLYVEENGCWSDTTAKLLGANPDFILETEKARGCDSLTVLFKGELNVEDALLFEWDFGDGSPIRNEQEVEHFYSSTGFYDVGLLITNTLSGCQIGFEIDSMIKVFPTPIAEITVDASICYPDSAELIYTHNIDSSICLWEFEGAHQSGTENDSILMIIDEPFGKAMLTVNEYGCISLPAETTLKRLPHFDFYTDFEEGCQPYSPEVFANAQDDFLDFTWLTDSLPHPIGNSTFFTFPDSGKVDVTLVATSTQTGCFDTLTKTDWIWIHPKPAAAFEVDYPVALLEHADITFSNYSESANYFFWDFGDEGTSTEDSPKHTYTQLGEYNSQLFVESDYGCKDTSAFVIKILPFSVFTPNAFRPDSEISENRTFMPVGVGADPSQFNLRIYDRWGQIIFESSSPEHPWDGTTKNGKPAPMGNYIWISNYYDIQGFEHNQKGQVVLVR